ncbi:hypothetical protein [Enterococcus spodopteracolus]|uniref:hypothetical protein n=1 Tax=Enterococcus spodopteracolus TaxID=3034501 RepID=UPI002649CA77|nr:hypothetical protein [Enterococcus spodopteracolus]
MVHFVSSSFFMIRALFLFRQGFLREFIMQEPPFFVKIKQESLALDYVGFPESTMSSVAINKKQLQQMILEETK